MELNLLTQDELSKGLVVSNDPNEKRYPELPYFSHSQLQTAYQCEKKWEFQYKMGKTRGPSNDMRLGSYIHAYLEMLYRMIMTSHGGVPQTLDPHEIDLAFSRVKVEPEDASLAMRAMALVAHYNRVIPRLDKNIKIAGIEDWMQVIWVTPEGRKIVFEGYIDLIVWDETKNGMEFRNVDHKSSGRAWTEEEVECDSQLQLYWLMLEAAGRPVTGGIINNIVTYQYSDLTQSIRDGKVYHRFRQKKNLEQIVNYGTDLGMFIDRLLSQTHFPRRWEKGCARCPFHDVCAAELSGDYKGADVLLKTQFLDKDKLRRVERGMEVKPQDAPAPTSFPVVRKKQPKASDWI